jgi:hypothetical protein
MKPASYVHGKVNVEKLERAARELLEIPALPDGATGPGSRALLVQIQADERAHGKAEALRRWADVSTVAYAFAFDDDPAEHRAASKMTIAHLEHPTRKGEYRFPHCTKLEAALSNPVARAKCSAEALAALDDHRSKVSPLPADWEPGDGKP